MLDNLIMKEEDKEIIKDQVEGNPYEIVDDEKGIPSTRQLNTNNSKKIFDPADEAEEAKNSIMNGQNTDRLMQTQQTMILGKNLI